MPVIRIVILLVAAVAAIAAAFLVRSMQASDAAPAPIAPIAYQAEPTVAAPVEPTLKVVVASQDLRVGQFITPGLLVWQAWPDDAIATSFYRDEDAPDAIPALEGAVVRTDMKAGEPLTAAKVVHPGEAGFMAAVLTPGMRAVSVEISSETAAGGFIFPNDHVDVLLTFSVDVEQPQGVTSETAIDTVLRNVRVLAIDEYYLPFDGQTAGQALVGHRATLELTHEDAMVLLVAQEKGDISFVLRSVSELDGPSGSTARARALASRRGAGSEGVRVFERGAPAAPQAAPPGARQSRRPPPEAIGEQSSDGV